MLWYNRRVRTLERTQLAPTQTRVPEPRLRWLIPALLVLALLGGNWEPAPTALERGDGYARNDQFAQAFTFYQVALRTPPESAEPAARLGQLFEQRRVLDRAEASFREARRLDLSNFQRWLDVGRIYGERGDLASALEALAEARRLAPEQGQVEVTTAQVYIASGQAGNALPLLEARLRGAPDDRSAHLLIAQALAAERPQEAIGHLQRAVEGPNDAISRDARELRDALKQVAGERDAAFLAVQVGDILSRRFDTGAAASAFESATRLKPAYAEAWAWLGLTRLQLGIKSAKAALDQAVQIDGDNRLAHYGLAQYFRASGDFDGALREFQKAAISETDLAAMAEVAETQGQMGDYEKAVATLKRVYDLRSKKDEAAAALARFYLRHGLSSSEAVRWAQTAASTVQNNAAYLALLGSAQIADQQAVPAEQTLRGAIKINPRAADAYFYLGQALELQRRARAAFDAYGQAFDLDDSGAIAARALTSMEILLGA